MIIIFILLWFNVLAGMEQEMPAPLVQKKPVWIPSLLVIAQRAVCSHIINKKITINDVRQFPPHEQDLIHSVITSEPKEVKSGEFYHLSTITPDHRYMLGADNKNQNILRLDLYTNETIIVDDSKENNLEIALSPSGNLVALASFQKIWIKDIVQNRVMIEKSIKEVLGVLYYPSSRHNLSFIGEKALVFSNDFNTVWLSVELGFHGYFASPLCNSDIKIIPTAQDLIIYEDYYEDGIFSRFTTGTIKNKARVKNLEGAIKLAFYEPDMLIAYESNMAYIGKAYNIGIVSLKDWPEIITPLVVRLKGRGEIVNIQQLTFANKGQWLMIAEGQWIGNNRIKGSKLTIWNWQYEQELYTYKPEYLIFSISCTDYTTPYPCLFKSNNVLYSFDPIKAVATTMLTRTAARKAAVTSNNNNNNNVSNDNGPKPKTSRKTTKQESGERKHKRPKK